LGRSRWKFGRGRRDISPLWQAEFLVFHFRTSVKPTIFLVYVVSSYLIFYPPRYTTSLISPLSTMPATQTTGIKPITLHALDFWGAPNPRKIAIALELLHIPYEVKLWQFGTADNGLAGPIFSQTINAVERVPVIHDPNTGIDAFESAAIINYLTHVRQRIEAKCGRGRFRRGARGRGSVDTLFGERAGGSDE
jgi:hypothetical protein